MLFLATVPPHILARQGPILYFSQNTVTADGKCTQQEMTDTAKNIRVQKRGLY